MPTLKEYGLTRGRLRLAAILAVVLLAVHGAVLYYVSSHIALSAGVIAGVVALIVIKHLGLLASTVALFRRRRGKR